MSEQNLSDFERIRRQVSIFNEIGKTLTSSLTIQEVIERIFYKVAEFFHPENWSLLLVDEQKNELYFEIVVGRVAEKIKNIRLKIGEGVAGWVAQHGRPLFVPSVQEDPRFSTRVDDMSQFSTESIICIPLKIRNRVLGVIELVNKKDITPLHQYDIEVLNTVAEYAAIALENAMNFEQVQKLTITDDLTGLYNSRHMHKLLQLEINRSRQEDFSFSIIFFDLDNFKQVNDKHGHLMGSRLLGEVGRLVASALKADQCAARYGGDEYVIILPYTTKQEALDICRMLQDRLNREQFFADENLDIRLTASFGIATFPEDADVKDRILQVADERMYKIKDSHKNGIASA